jgi:hypothetical protein
MLIHCCILLDFSLWILLWCTDPRTLSYIIYVKLVKMVLYFEMEIFNKISYCIRYLSDTSYCLCYKMFYGNTHLIWIPFFLLTPLQIVRFLLYVIIIADQICHFVMWQFFCCCGAATQRGSWSPHSWGFLDHTQRLTTVGRTPLDEWSTRHRDPYLTTHNIYNRQTSMSLVDSNPRSQQASGSRPTP